MLAWPSLLKSKAFWSATLAFFVCLDVGFLAWSLDRDPDRFQAVASLNYSTIRFDQVACLSIDPHKVVFDKKDYSDPELVKSIANILSIKTLLFNADYATCPWGLTAVVVPGTIFAVRYGVWPARYLVSVAICERTATGSLNPDKCISKNIYVFNWRAKPQELFTLGLIGLVRPQASEWEAFESSP